MTHSHLHATKRNTYNLLYDIIAFSVRGWEQVAEGSLTKSPVFWWKRYDVLCFIEHMSHVFLRRTCCSLYYSTWWPVCSAAGLTNGLILVERCINQVIKLIIAHRWGPVLQNNASKLLLAIMESRHDSENAEKILYKMRPTELVSVCQRVQTHTHTRGLQRMFLEFKASIEVFSAPKKQK